MALMLRATSRIILALYRLISQKIRFVDSWLQTRSPRYKSLRRYMTQHPYQRATSVFFVVLMITSILLRFTVSASDLNKTWDFSNSSDYTLSSSNDLEYSGGSVRLKAQNYASDANTAGLYHFDENTGSSAQDSSTGANDLTLSNTAWNSGELNTALSFNGASSSASAPDSSSLSLTQANTLEGWTKFENAFSAGSHSSVQPVVDKGSYKLYYDHETGKPTYELENSSATTWTQRATGA